MQLSTESLLIILLVGAIAGWLAGQIVRGYGFGLLGNIAIGIVGALIGSWLFPQIGVFLGTGIVASIVNATLGAILLLLVLGLVGRRGGRFWRR
ncbi:GlsB/YeaQ/YmgE family stress response membrane protein [Devosia sp.]|uniref:GlsB/YeaQ/YmgE family stress response membrane protein n=1 Tax=Devosia sp. TaxID=1871048 RepID=UPI003262D454